jgi:hypothetical protein
LLLPFPFVWRLAPALHAKRICGTREYQTPHQMHNGYVSIVLQPSRKLPTRNDNQGRILGPVARVSRQYSPPRKATGTSRSRIIGSRGACGRLGAPTHVHLRISGNLREQSFDPIQRQPVLMRRVDLNIGPKDFHWLRNSRLGYFFIHVSINNTKRQLGNPYSRINSP